MTELVPARAAIVQEDQAQCRVDVGVPEPDRSAIRKSRKQAAKRSKHLVRERFDEIHSARPEGSRPADKILSRAVELYRDGPIPRRKLKEAIAKLEAIVRKDIPDLNLQRAPRTVSARPETVGLMIYETRAVTAEDQQFITAENHSVVLAEDRVFFISGLLPGGTRPHLFERIFERSGGRSTLADIQLHLSALWPTLIWMRSRQRLEGRGNPLRVMMTPFEDGLLFGDLQKVVVPPAGPTVAVVYRGGQQTRIARDDFADPAGNRPWAMTKTFVDGSLLSPEQVKLRDTLRRYIREYEDVVADNNWRWRIGIHSGDPAVRIVSETFRLTVPSAARCNAALADLDVIVESDSWQSVAERSWLNQQKRQHGHQA